MNKFSKMDQPGPSRDLRDHLGRNRYGSNQNRNKRQHRSRSPQPNWTQGRNNRNLRGSTERNQNRNDYNANSVRGTGQRVQSYKRQERYMGFKILEEISQSDSQDILVKINQRKDAFTKLIQSQIERPDIFVLITDLMAKVSESSFNELKVQILQEICNSAYLGNFQKYLMDIPYMQAHEISSNNLYWKNQEDFWVKFVTFGECLMTLLPVTALHKCRSLIEDSSKLCLEKLAERHDFKLSDECNSRLTQLRERLTLQEKELKDTQEKKKTQSGEGNIQPPEGFRELNVIPDPEELLGRRPFLRPNIVKSGYEDKEHYLDVQYRLLREDCFGPLREGIRQYMAEPNKGKYDHIRVYNNVKFLGPYMPKSRNNIGSMVQMNINSKRWPKRVNWAHSKRFLFGSLVLFTRDKCNSFIIATLMERDVQLLSQGMFAVSLINSSTEDIYDDKPYVMIESEVYFEPYFQVLNALKAPDFPDHMAMEKYIVKVDTQSTPPAFLNAEKQFEIRTKAAKLLFTVLDDESWPNKDDLGFDESQYEAFKLALKNEFAVIQGPPGTGKTFLGVKVAKTLLKNLRHDFKGCQLLVICYTNHALDQFLEALLPTTDSIVRIGGQSRNEAMDNINLKNLRQNIEKCYTMSLSTVMMRDKKRELRQAVLELEHALNCLDIITNGVLTYESVESYVPKEIGFLGRYYSGHGITDPLKYWLFEHCLTYIGSEISQWDRFENRNIGNARNYDDDVNKRNEPDLDDFGDESCEVDDQIIKASFTINTAEAQIENFYHEYNKVQNIHQKRKLDEAARILNCEINLFKEMSAYRKSISHRKLTRSTNFNAMKTVDRWTLYFRWANIIADNVEQKIPVLQQNVKKAISAYEESRMIVDLELLREKRVVGMTTSGAARLRKLLQSLGPPIVIVEEAAEVLEAHIVTSLTKDCQHLILIGDHQQLRPSISNLKLVRRYNTNVSLFERMITNGVESRRLGVQHRMRPEIAALISPHIYSDLHNHPSVEKFPNVLGTTCNLFFLTHDFQEQEVDDSASRTNHQEADLTIALANYLMQQGYSPEDVTILTTYKGQMFYLRKQRENYLLLANIKITVVDNYQGEESKIILLSLVRNNPDNNVGFLKIENRICVALSRAKEGLYIFGNIETLKTNSDLWKKIAETLEINSSLGKTLTLKCENHPETTVTVSSAEDFTKIPEGGCGVDCNFQRPCGHKCPRICHVFDMKHEQIKCLEACTKTLCDLGHKCPLLCWEPCTPCNQLVEKELPCGHKKNVACHKEPNDPHIKCYVQLDVVLPACSHNVKKNCHEDLESVRCSENCLNRVDPCGHRCGRKCHVNDDPDHEKYICLKPCAKAKTHCQADLIGDRGDHQCKNKCFETCDPCDVKVEKKRTCGHLQRVLCSEDVDKIPCKMICKRILECKHKCQKKCGQECGQCFMRVDKIIPECKHEIKIACSMEAVREFCNKKCERVMSCGHPCTGFCRQPCDPKTCFQIVPGKFTAPCGHEISLPCNAYNAMTKGDDWKPEQMLRYCTQPCLQELACSHLCGGSCSVCYQGRLHVPCSQICNQNNICGHQCMEPCNQMCPPCNQRCNIQCSCGLRCNRQCGAPCTPCSEPCSRKCRHGACNRRCGEPCSRPPCDEACELKLPCGHRCRGLCGEPCPDICNVCRPDDFPRDLLGDEYGESEKFIKLQDCSHIFEIVDMDSWMKSNPEQIKIPGCPKCRKPIVNTYRYKDTINHMIKKEINPIKERVYGTLKKILAKKKDLYAQLVKFREHHQTVLQENPLWKKAFYAIKHDVTGHKRTSLLKVEMHLQYLKILDMISQCHETYKNKNLTHLKSEFQDIIKILCSILVNSVQKISQQQQKDIGNEIKRLHSIIQFSTILGPPLTNEFPEVVEKAIGAAREVVLTWKRYDEEEALHSLRKLQDAVKVTGIAMKQERELVVKAIGLKAGHWYKCENGHFYCIGECGGATEQSKCIECKAVIGGRSHTLAAGNTHAPEMDGSRFAAWSAEYNNMANFNLDG